MSTLMDVFNPFKMMDVFNESIKENTRKRNFLARAQELFDHLPSEEREWYMDHPDQFARLFSLAFSNISHATDWVIKNGEGGLYSIEDFRQKLASKGIQLSGPRDEFLDKLLTISKSKKELVSVRPGMINKGMTLQEFCDHLNNYHAFSLTSLETALGLRLLCSLENELVIIPTDIKENYQSGEMYVVRFADNWVTFAKESTREKVPQYPIVFTKG